MELKLTMVRVFCLLFFVNLAAFSRPLLVISIDGLDHRYLRDRDQLGLRIPTLRRLLASAQWADQGVVGVVPTVTFPSHTSIVTGVPPQRHGIINNNQPNGERYWFSSFLKVPTLWDAARAAGNKVGAVHWPVTVGSAIDFDFPEYFRRRQGAGMDWESTALKATPGLVEKMIARFPSMPQEWIDDRVRTLATIYLLETEKPDLVLVHLIDHDSEAHETGPFSLHANAILELTDEYLERILAAKPADMAVAIVSDHGFERIDRVVNPWLMLRRNGVAGTLKSAGTYLTTNDDAVARFFRSQAGIREIPLAEWDRFLPGVERPLAAFEAPPNAEFTRSPDGAEGERKGGDHGFWPTRPEFRSTFLVSGPGISPSRLGEIDMLSIAGRLADILGISFGKE